MILADRDIIVEHEMHRLGIEPFNIKQVQPASYDVCLGDSLLVWSKKTQYDNIIDPRRPSEMERIEIPQGGILLQAGAFTLGSTVEFFRFDDRTVGRLDGKSSIGRLGISIHITAGFFDPGFQGTATLEILNCNRYAGVILYPGMAIGQMSFWRTLSFAVAPYGHPSRNSKYQGQMTPTESQYFRNES